MSFAHLDQQLKAVRASADVPDLADEVWDALATTVHAEVVALGDAAHNQLRLELLIPPERYVEELTAFQAWMEVARANAANPVIVRAQVMTEIYVAFVWLRDSLMKPVAARTPEDSVVRIVHRLLSTGRRRLLRNAIAHGRWRYLSDFRGLEYWLPGGAFEGGAPSAVRDPPSRTRCLAASGAGNCDRDASRTGRRPLSSRFSSGRQKSRGNHGAGVRIGGLAHLPFASGFSPRHDHEPS